MGNCLTFNNYPGYPTNFAGRRTRVQLGENTLYVIPAHVSSRFDCETGLTILIQISRARPTIHLVD